VTRYFTNPKLLNAPIKRAAYSDRTSWIMSQCSELAYVEDSVLLRKDLVEGDFTLLKTFVYKPKDMNAYLALSTKHKLAVLAFKGTKPSEWPTVQVDLDFKYYHTKNGVFHKGFYEAFKAMEKPINRALGSVRDLPIYITGHSLGGALATVAAMNLTETDRVAACYTFGAPRICDLKTIIKFYKIPVYRVVHADDVVPSLPPPSMFGGYAQIGDLRYITDNFELIPGSAAVWLRLWLQIKSLILVRCKTYIEDHMIGFYSKILQKIAEEREDHHLHHKFGKLASKIFEPLKK
jgi:hypothetical protein